METLPIELLVLMKEYFYPIDMLSISQVNSYWHNWSKSFNPKFGNVRVTKKIVIQNIDIYDKVMLPYFLPGREEEFIKTAFEDKSLSMLTICHKLSPNFTYKEGMSNPIISFRKRFPGKILANSALRMITYANDKFKYPICFVGRCSYISEV